MNATEAYLAINPNVPRDSARVTACEQLKSFPEIRQYAIEYMLKHKGLEVDNVLNKLSELINEPNKEVIDKRGNVKTLKDGNISNEALKTALKIYRLYADEDRGQAPSYNLTIQANPEQLTSIVQELRSIAKSIGQSDKEQTGEVIDVHTPSVEK